MRTSHLCLNLLVLSCALWAANSQICLFDCIIGGLLDFASCIIAPGVALITDAVVAITSATSCSDVTLQGNSELQLSDQLSCDNFHWTSGNVTCKTDTAQLKYSTAVAVVGTSSYTPCMTGTFAGGANSMVTIASGGSMICNSCNHAGTRTFIQLDIGASYVVSGSCKATAPCTWTNKDTTCSTCKCVVQGTMEAQDQLAITSNVNVVTGGHLCATGAGYWHCQTGTCSVQGGKVSCQNAGSCGIGTDVAAAVLEFRGADASCMGGGNFLLGAQGSVVIRSGHTCGVSAPTVTSGSGSMTLESGCSMDHDDCHRVRVPCEVREQAVVHVKSATGRCHVENSQVMTVKGGIMKCSSPCCMSRSCAFGEASSSHVIGVENDITVKSKLFFSGAVSSSCQSAVVHVHEGSCAHVDVGHRVDADEGCEFRGKGETQINGTMCHKTTSGGGFACHYNQHNVAVGAQGNLQVGVGSEVHMTGCSVTHHEACSTCDTITVGAAAAAAAALRIKGNAETQIKTCRTNVADTAKVIIEAGSTLRSHGECEHKGAGQVQVIGTMAVHEQHFVRTAKCTVANTGAFQVCDNGHVDVDSEAVMEVAGGTIDHSTCATPKPLCIGTSAASGAKLLFSGAAESKLKSARVEVKEMGVMEVAQGHSCAVVSESQIHSAGKVVVSGAMRPVSNLHMYCNDMTVKPGGAMNVQEGGAVNIPCGKTLVVDQGSCKGVGAGSATSGGAHFVVGSKLSAAETDAASAVHFASSSAGGASEMCGTFAMHAQAAIKVAENSACRVTAPTTIKAMPGTCCTGCGCGSNNVAGHLKVEDHFTSEVHTVMSAGSTLEVAAGKTCAHKSLTMADSTCETKMAADTTNAVKAVACSESAKLNGKLTFDVTQGCPTQRTVLLTSAQTTGKFSSCTIVKGAQSANLPMSVGAHLESVGSHAGRRLLQASDTSLGTIALEGNDVVYYPRAAAVSAP